MRFYKTQAVGSSAHGVMVRDGDELYSYLPNTDLWHHSPELATDFYFEQEGVYTEVAPEEVSALLAEVPRIDERGPSGLYVQRRRNQPAEDIRTSSDLGVGSRSGVTRFYKIENPRSDAYGVLVRDGDELYAYLPNTGLWHRSTALETDFHFDQERTYVEVDPEEVPALTAGVRHMDERGSGGLHLRRRNDQPPEDIRTSSSLGIPTKAHEGP